MIQCLPGKGNSVWRTLVWNSEQINLINVRNIPVFQGSCQVSALADEQEENHTQGFWLYKFWILPNSKPGMWLRDPGMYTVKQSSPEGAFFICVINIHLIIVACNYQKAADRSFYWRQKKWGSLRASNKRWGRGCSLEQLVLFLAEGSQLLQSFWSNDGWSLTWTILSLMRLICLGWDWGNGLGAVKRPFAS